jgi:hypothetical protein
MCPKNFSAELEIRKNCHLAVRIRRSDNGDCQLDVHDEKVDRHDDGK